MKKQSSRKTEELTKEQEKIEESDIDTAKSKKTLTKKLKVQIRRQKHLRKKK